MCVDKLVDEFLDEHSLENKEKFIKDLTDFLVMIDNRFSFHKLVSTKVSPDLSSGKASTHVPLRHKPADVLVLMSVSPTRVKHLECAERWVEVPRIVLSFSPDFSNTSRSELKEQIMAGVEALSIYPERLWFSLIQECSYANEKIGFAKFALTDSISNDLEKSLSRLEAQSLYNGYRLSDHSICFLSTDLYQNLVSSEEAFLKVKPTPKQEVLMTGHVGTLSVGNHTIALYTDAYRNPEHKVFPLKTLIHVSDPLNHGYYVENGIRHIAVNSDGSIDMFNNCFSMAVTSAQSVVTNL